MLLERCFFPTILKCVCLQLLWKAHRAAWQLKTCFLSVRISLCETQGKMLFFTPAVVYGKQVSKSTSENIDKSNTIWKAHALILHHSMLHDNSKMCFCDSRSQLSTLTCECEDVCYTQHLNWSIIVFYLHTESQGVRPKDYSFWQRYWKLFET